MSHTHKHMPITPSYQTPTASVKYPLSSDECPFGTRQAVQTATFTCAALVAGGKTEQMGFHFPRAIENGVTQEELIELITHLAFYTGWPNAMSAVMRAKELLGASQP